MKRNRRYRSINFILWVSFLGFAGFILILTWVFQTALLKTFLTVQVKEELETLGKEVYQYLTAGPISSDRIEKYLLYKEGENRATNIYILELADGKQMYPSGNEGNGVKVSEDTFRQIQSKLELLDHGQNVLLQTSGTSYVYAAKMVLRSGVEGRDICLLINYSTVLVQKTVGDMKM